MLFIVIINYWIEIYKKKYVKNDCFTDMRLNSFTIKSYYVTKAELEEQLTT